MGGLSAAHDRSVPFWMKMQSLPNTMPYASKRAADYAAREQCSIYENISKRLGEIQSDARAAHFLYSDVEIL